MCQSAALGPLFCLQAFPSHLNQSRGFKFHLNLLAPGIFSPPGLFSIFPHPGLYVIYQQASLCLPAPCWL